MSRAGKRSKARHRAPRASSFSRSPAVWVELWSTDRNIDLPQWLPKPVRTIHQNLVRGLSKLSKDFPDIRISGNLQMHVPNETLVGVNWKGEPILLPGQRPHQRPKQQDNS